ncbi:hypothetical protein Cni_G00480 [Canna indica]|uniref:YGGT family protein n=1 Tax=Canna indica TaxID=4628 RepID=A0AAQ3JL13_9LILI|nr:hypothetical protein Cni_G00480 [Canna indica]
MAAVVPTAAATALSNPNLCHPLLRQASPTVSLLRLPRRSPLPGAALRLRLSPLRRPRVPLRASAAVVPPPPSTLLSESTRTLASLLALALSVSKAVLSSFCRFAEKAAAAAARAAPSAEELAELRSLQSNLAWAAGPLFFAARRMERPSGYLNTPLTVVASGMAKWLDIYSGVLMVRVLLSWFPNIPWDRQPLSAIRDLCDPYLNLFRNIIPPVFDTLDVSPLLAFAVLGTLGSILNSSRGMH